MPPTPRYGWTGSVFHIGAKVRVLNGQVEGTIVSGPYKDLDGELYWYVEYPADSIQGQLANNIKDLFDPDPPPGALPQLEKGLVAA
jgi:hypothetical protein